MIGIIKKTATLNGTTWVEINDFEGRGEIVELWMKIPDNIGTGTNIIVGLFNAGYLTDGDERYNSGNQAENGTRILRYMTESATDLLMCIPYVDGDLLKVKADDAATKDVEFMIYVKE